jgi:hypothetical protein
MAACAYSNELDRHLDKHMSKFHLQAQTMNRFLKLLESVVGLSRREDHISETVVKIILHGHEVGRLSGRHSPILSDTKKRSKNRMKSFCLKVFKQP